MAENEQIKVLSEMEYEITMEEVLPSVVTEGGTMNHALLNNREVPNQHPIVAIEGLREELDEIKTLKTIYSDKIGVANYYKWDTGAYDTFGYFVSMKTPDTIEICTGADIFGVTVDGTMVGGFVGGQDATTTRDNTYALVVTSGIAEVRCETGVAVGNYVVCSNSGIAKKTDTGCGYKVVGLETRGGTDYAIISLDVQACTTDVMGARLQQLEADLDSAEINIVATMNLANEAYSKALNTENTTSQDLIDITTKVDGAVSAVEGAQNSVSNAITTADAAKIIAEKALIAANATGGEAAKDAAEALAKATEIERSVAPITTWTDPESGNVGATYYVKYIENGLSTKVEMETVERLDEENKLLIEKNAENYRQMLSSVDKYSIGEYSQAYGLTLEQAKSILKKGMIYIPTVKHFEDTFASGEQELILYASYEWDEEKWVETANSVSFAPIVPEGISIKYWYIDSNSAPEGYKTYTLYILVDDVWTEVATLAGNVNNRITSIIRQEVDEVALEVINARGSGASLKERLSNTDAAIESNAFWKKDDGTEYVAAFRQVAGEGENGGSSLALVAYKTNSDGSEDESMEIQGASFVVGTNEDGSNYIDFKADNINLTADQIAAIADEIDLTADQITAIANEIDLTGYVTIGDLSGEGTTTIDGSNITTGIIKSEGYEHTEGDTYSTKGIALDLDNGCIRSPNFVIKEDGDAYFNGELGANAISAIEIEADKLGVEDLKAFGATIGGWNITENGIENDDTLINSKDENTNISLVSSEKNSPIRISVGARDDTDDEIERIFYTVEEDFYDIGSGSNLISVELDDGRYLRSVEILETYLEDYEGGTTDIECFISDISNTEEGSSFILQVPDYDSEAWTFRGSYRYTCIQEVVHTVAAPAFQVLADGSLYARNARIDGKINTTKGKIANLIITDDGLTSSELPDEGFKLNNQGMIFYDDTASLNFGDRLGIAADSTSGKIIANGPLEIVGAQSSIKLNTDGVGRRAVVRYSVYANYYKKESGKRYVTIRLNHLAGHLLREQEIVFKWYSYIDDSSMKRIAQGTSTSTLYQDGSGGTVDIQFTDSNWAAQIRFVLNVCVDNRTFVYLFFTKEHAAGGGEFKMGDTICNIVQYKSSSNIEFIGNLMPGQTSMYNLGSETALWQTIYAKDNTINVSDRNKKNSIQPLSEVHEQIFDALEPVSYKFNANNNNRTHTGFIAQDVKNAVESAGLTTQDFAAYCEWDNDDDTKGYGLRYSEFIALCVSEIQKLKKRVTELEDKLNNTK